MARERLYKQGLTFPPFLYVFSATINPRNTNSREIKVLYLNWFCGGNMGWLTTVFPRKKNTKINWKWGCCPGLLLHVLGSNHWEQVVVLRRTNLGTTREGRDRLLDKEFQHKFSIFRGKWREEKVVLGVLMC